METLIEMLLKTVPLNSLTLVGTITILCVLVWNIRPQLAQLTEQVKATNGSVRDLKTWREGHDKQDDQRHEENLETLKEMNGAIRDLTLRKRP
jgi:hypothetical protein